MEILTIEQYQDLIHDVTGYDYADMNTRRGTFKQCLMKHLVRYFIYNHLNTSFRDVAKYAQCSYGQVRQSVNTVNDYRKVYKKIAVNINEIEKILKTNYGNW